MGNPRSHVYLVTCTAHRTLAHLRQISSVAGPFFSAEKGFVYSPLFSAKVEPCFRKHPTLLCWCSAALCWFPPWFPGGASGHRVSEVVASGRLELFEMLPCATKKKAIFRGTHFFHTNNALDAGGGS